MTFLYRLTLGVAILNFLASAVVALVYYVWVRPEWRDPDFARGVEATLRDPSTPMETIREIALKSHELVLNSLATTETAVEMALYTCFGVALFLGYIAYALRAHAKDSKSAL